MTTMVVVIGAWERCRLTSSPSSGVDSGDGRSVRPDAYLLPADRLRLRGAALDRVRCLRGRLIAVTSDPQPPPAGWRIGAGAAAKLCDHE